MTRAAGDRFGGYEIVGPLGAGGMGEVYPRARHQPPTRNVAIKFLPSAFTTDPDRVARFEREARLLAAVNHPNIATSTASRRWRRQRAGDGARRGRHACRTACSGVRALADQHGLDPGLKAEPRPTRPPLAKRWRSQARSPMRSMPRTREGSSTAISSPPTSRSRQTAS